MNQPIPTLSVTAVTSPLPHLPEGEHEMTVVSADLRVQRNRFGDKYTALHLTFASDMGLTASSMAPEFKGGIARVLSAMNQPTLMLSELSAPALMALRGQRARVTVAHAARGSNLYVNVTSINGVTL